MRYLPVALLCLLPAIAWNQQNVGIGTSNPQSKLDILATGDGTEVLRLSTGSPWVFKQRLTGSNTRLSLQSTVNDRIFELLAVNGTHRSAEFLVNSTNSRILLVPDGGEVGIGLNDATGKLHVKHNSLIGSPQLRLTESGFDYARMKMENDARPNAYWDIAGLADTIANNARLNFFFSAPGGGGDRMTITGDGRVGIGTTNPGNRLRITGDANSTAHILSAGSTYSGNSHIRALEGFAIPAPGFGYGGYMVGGSVGASAIGQGTTATGTVIGVRGEANGSAGTRIGVYGTATGGSTNWAGYFASGNVYVTNDLRIGADAAGGVPGYKVAVDGKIIAEELRIQLSGAWPDYVFEPSYALPSLALLEEHILQHRHLPGVPSADEVRDEGIVVGDMQRVLLEKIEELTLHILALNRRIETLENKVGQADDDGPQKLD